MTSALTILSVARRHLSRLLLLVALSGPPALRALQPAGAVEGAGGGLSSAGPYAVDSTLGESAVGIGVSRAGDVAVTDGFWNTLNSVPVVPERSLSFGTGQPIRVSAAILLNSATDEDGDALTVTAVSASSAQGGTVVLENGDLIYTSPDGMVGADSFTYTVTDSSGDTSVGTVTVIRHVFRGTVFLFVFDVKRLCLDVVG